MSDEELLQSLADRPYQESLHTYFVQRFGNLLFAVCYRILQNSELAMDAFQEALTRIFSKIHQYNGSENPERWLFAITRNAAIDQYRRRSIRQRHTGGDFTHVQPIAPEDDSDPDRDLLLNRVIRELPVEQQAVLLLVSGDNGKLPGLGYATLKATAEALDYRNDQGNLDHNRVYRLLKTAYASLRHRFPQAEDQP